jgi:hypothetical protein
MRCNFTGHILWLRNFLFLHPKGITRLRVFEDRVLWRFFGPKKGKNRTGTIT